MKKGIILVFLALVLAFPLAVSAAPHHNWSEREFHRNTWERVDHAAPPFAWHVQRGHFAQKNYKMKPMYNREWQNRFPGLHAYQWRDKNGPGFWYHGRRIRDAVMLYNLDDELVGVGFNDKGVFIILRDDDRSYRTHDPFFVSRRRH